MISKSLALKIENQYICFILYLQQKKTNILLYEIKFINSNIYENGNKLIIN